MLTSPPVQLSGAPVSRLSVSTENPLPSEIRQNVANVGMYIMSQTIAATANPKVEIVSSLVTINRELAAGLRGQG